MLRLNGNRLRRRLCPSLGSCCLALEDLDMSNNLMTGPLPATLDTMPALRYLRLQVKRAPESTAFPSKGGA